MARGHDLTNKYDYGGMFGPGPRGPGAPAAPPGRTDHMGPRRGWLRGWRPASAPGTVAGDGQGRPSCGSWGTIGCGGVFVVNISEVLCLLGLLA